MPDHRKLILLSVVGLTSLLFIEFALHQLFGVLRVKVAGTFINMTGLYLLVSFFITFLFAFIKVLKQDPDTSFFYLLVLAFIITLLSEFVFQSFRQLTFLDITPAERVRFFLLGVLGIPVFASIIAFSIAFAMKFKKVLLSIVLTIGLLLIAKFVAQYFGLIGA